MLVRDIAQALGAQLDGDGEVAVGRLVHPSQAEGPSDLALATSPQVVAALAQTKASAVVIAAAAPRPNRAFAAVIAVTEPRLTLARLTALVNANEAADRMRFTAAMSNGQNLYAFRYAVNDRANTLYYRESETTIVIVSEPLDKDHNNWISVPENHVIVALAGERARVRPLLQRHQEAAE